jgi:hypothetical protein
MEGSQQRTMTYTEFARERRRCTQLTRAGDECRAYAVWGDPDRRCRVHGGIVPLERRLVRQYRDGGYAAPVVCRCPAYPWPHRPAGGLCMWPHLPGTGPRQRSTVPLGTRSWLHAARRASRRARRADRERRRADVEFATWRWSARTRLELEWLSLWYTLGR